MKHMIKHGLLEQRRPRIVGGGDGGDTYLFFDSLAAAIAAVTGASGDGTGAAAAALRWTWGI